MRITDVRTHLLTGPATLDPFLSECRVRRSVALIEVSTDAAFSGLGETYAGYFCPELVPGIVEFFRPILIGQSVDDIPSLWARMYHCGNFWCRVGLGSAVLNGIEAALWDLRGKAEGVPVHQLLGGLKHQSLPCYASGGPSNYPKEQLAKKIDFYLSLGFHGFKLGTGAYSKEGSWEQLSGTAAADFEADKLQFVRAHVGNDVKVMLDGHMGNHPKATWDLETAQLVMKAVEPFGLLFFEEPLHYTNLSGYSELCRTSPVPIAGGECLTSASEWKVFVEHDCFDIGQPDASFSGSLFEFMKIAEMLHARGRKLATHSWGAGASLMQNVHCAFAAANTLIVEVPPAYGPLHSELLGDSFVMKEGRILPPQTPGLGIVLSESTKNRFPFVPGSGEYNSVPGKILPEDEPVKTVA